MDKQLDEQLFEIIQLLIEKNASINETTDETSVLFEAIVSENTELLELLLDPKFGIDVNQKLNKETALDYAIKNSSLNVIKTLLKHPKIEVSPNALLELLISYNRGLWESQNDIE